MEKPEIFSELDLFATLSQSDSDNIEKISKTVENPDMELNEMPHEK